MMGDLYKINLLFDNSTQFAKVAELVDALDLGSSGATRESSSLSFRTISIIQAASQFGEPFEFKNDNLSSEVTLNGSFC